MKTKNILALLLILTILASLSISAVAAPADLTGHTYSAFQIFAGTQEAGTTDGNLGQVTWGSGINSAVFLSALKNSADFGTPNPFLSANTAAEVARVIDESAQFGDNTPASVALSKIAYVSRVASAGIPCQSGTTSLDAGYYLVVDTTEFGENDTNTVSNLALLQLTGKGTFEINNKASVPTIEKKVRDTNYSAGVISDWQDSADYDIGDEVPFRVSVTLGDMMGYSMYSITVHDTLSSGLTYVRKPMVIKNGDVDVSSHFNVLVAGNEITVSCIDVLPFAKANDVITFEYSATLNENAVIGPAGNDNTVYLTYSNNPNELARTGKTPTDLVRIFTYALVLNKIDEAQKPLAGAEFQLLKKNATDTYVPWMNESKSMGQTGTDKSVFNWKGLDDGEYQIVETKTPDGYNTADPIFFTVTAEHQVVSDNPQLTKLNSTAPVTADATVGTMSVDVVNEGGVILPETGSEGTNMIYLLGSVLLLGGLVLIVTKKRVGDAG
jgi:fimbrial isopeptide formation D2 family protein/LPXTG-motif cell wall-anchored protein